MCEIFGPHRTNLYYGLLTFQNTQLAYDEVC